MNDTDRQLLERIDRELGDALSLAPSSDLVRRVRERIAREPDRNAVPMVRWLLLAGAAAAVVFAVWTTDRAPAPSPADRVKADAARGEAGASRPDAQANAAVRRPIEAREVRLKPHSTRRATPPARDARNPEVLVPQKDRVAFERFAAALRAGRIDESVVATVLLRPAAHITIAPIEITPLPVVNE